MSVHSFSIASVLFPIWVRYFWLVIIMHPSVSKNFFTSLLLIIVKTWSGYKALEFERMKCNLTLVSTLFTFCPPGPPDLLVSKVTSEVMISLLIFCSFEKDLFKYLITINGAAFKNLGKNEFYEPDHSKLCVQGYFQEYVFDKNCSANVIKRFVL